MVFLNILSWAPTIRWFFLSWKLHRLLSSIKKKSGRSSLCPIQLFLTIFLFHLELFHEIPFFHLSLEVLERRAHVFCLITYLQICYISWIWMISNWSYVHGRQHILKFCFFLSIFWLNMRMQLWGIVISVTWNWIISKTYI